MYFIFVLGGHINPAVTLAMCICGRLPWRKFPIYMLAQFVGAFLASALCFGVYKGWSKKCFNFKIKLWESLLLQKCEFLNVEFSQKKKSANCKISTLLPRSVKVISLSYLFSFIAVKKKSGFHGLFISIISNSWHFFDFAVF